MENVLLSQHHTAGASERMSEWMNKIAYFIVCGEKLEN